MSNAVNLESGTKLFEDGDYRGAKDAFSWAAGTLERDDNKEELSSALHWLGKSQYKLGEYSEALDSLTRARELRERLNGASSVPAALVDVDLGKVYQELERGEDAINTVAGALETLKEHAGANSLEFAAASSALGVLHAQRNNEAAEPLINRGLGIRRAQLGQSHRLIAESLNDLSYCNFLANNSTMSNVLGRKALAMMEKHLGENHAEVGMILYNLSNQYVKQRAFGKAEISSRRGYAILKEQFPADHEVNIWIADRLGTTCMVMYNLEEAKELHECALNVAERKWGKDSPKIVNSLVGLGSVHLNRNEYLLAEPYFKRALNVLGNFAKLDGTTEYNATKEYGLLQQLSCCYVFQLKLGDALRLVPDSFRAKHTSDFSRAIDLIKGSVEFVLKQIDRMQKE
jgi:hypothetical protein